MIIWTGFGCLVAVIGFGVLVVTELVSESIVNDDKFYQENPWVILVGMTVAAILTFGLHKILQLKQPRVVIDKQTGQEIEMRESHSLFFIPVKWWPVVFILLGLIFVFSGGSDSEGKAEEAVLDNRTSARAGGEMAAEALLCHEDYSGFPA